MGEAVDSKPKQKDLREKLLRSKVMSCRADKVKRLERWKEKRDDAKSVDKEKEREMLIAKMRSEDKEEASKLMSRLRRTMKGYSISFKMIQTMGEGKRISKKSLC